MFGIDTLAIDKSSRPVLIECKWNMVDAGALEQLERYEDALRSGWQKFEDRVSAFRGRRTTIDKDKCPPVLVTVGYTYEPSVLKDDRSFIFLTYRYNAIELTGDVLERPRPGTVTIERVRDVGDLPGTHHPPVSKVHYTHRRLAVLPSALRRSGLWMPS